MSKKRTTKPSRPDDARTRRTINALRDALMKLLQTKSLEDISNKEISASAGVSYPTFYRRFSSKHDLLQHIAREEVRTILSFGEDPASPNYDPVETFREICTYIDSNRNLYATLLNKGAAAAMRQEFMHLASASAQSRPRFNPWIPEDLGPPFIVSGIFEIFSWWLRQPDDYPLEDVITIFDKLIIDVGARSHDVTLKSQKP